MAIGDHLYIQHLTHQHHAIDLGEGTVIEYGVKGTGFMSVRRVWRNDFLARGPCFVRNYAPGSARHPSQTVQLAWTRLREQRYDLFNNNCEHLASWCKTGGHFSRQAETLKGTLVIGTIVGAIALLAGAASKED